MARNFGKYVLVTPARNEEAHIERLLQVVVAQTLLPRKYVIVSDGSTDRTDEIVRAYAERYDFIELVRAEKDSRAGFGSKVFAFNTGYARMRNVPYEFIGNLDADVSFEPDYFERLLSEFNRNERLGLAGGLVYQPYRGTFRSVHKNHKSHDNVAGAVQLFRRECFEQIGGYIPLRGGGIDTAAEIMARMRGWRVETVRSCIALSHRPMRTGKGSELGQRFNKGAMNWQLGYHPLFQLAIFCRRIPDPPFFFGALWTLAGYFWTALRCPERQVTQEFVTFLRNEQMERLGLKRAK